MGDAEQVGSDSPHARISRADVRSQRRHQQRRRGTTSASNRPHIRQERSAGVRWRSVVWTGLLMVLAAALVASAALVFIFHPRFETVLSGSMRPDIQPGDIAVVHPVSASELQVGDVISFLPPQQSTPVLHRIVDLNTSGIITQGDANTVADPWGRIMPQEDAVNRLAFVVPKLGFVAANRPLIIGGAAVLLIIAGALALWPRCNEDTVGRDVNDDGDLLAVASSDSTAAIAKETVITSSWPPPPATPIDFSVAEPGDELTLNSSIGKDYS